MLGLWGLTSRDGLGPKPSYLLAGFLERPKQERWRNTMNATQVKGLAVEFLRDVYEIPNGEKIDQCLQCGTCSASCPASEAMKYPPRKILAALRAGMLDQVFESPTVWLCASCYSCTVRCPAGIPFTEVMYELKRLGIRRGLLGKKSSGVALAETFMDGVYRYGRSSDAELICRYILRSHPAKAFSFAHLGWKLLRKGRLSLRTRKIAGIDGLRKMMAAMEKEDAL
jgi:heterodisulfide reductase subunit C